jgi:hypothetical protein
MNRHDTLLACCVVTQLVIALLLGPICHDLLRIQLSPHDPSIFRNIVRSWTSNGQLHYFKRHFLLDSWYPLLYGAFLRERLAFVLPPPASALGVQCQWWGRVAALGAFLDIVENSVHQYMLVTGSFMEDAPEGLIRAAAAAATAKWLLLLPVVVIVFPLSPWSRRAREQANQKVRGE